MNLNRGFGHRLQYKWWVFGAVAAGTFVSVQDQTGVNLALPRIADHFGASIPAVQWVALGYILTTGSLLLPMGRLSDIIGRKQVYAAGFVLFILGAAMAGASNSLLSVIIFKVLQGVGAAMVQANGMAIVASTFHSSERGKVIGLFMTVVGVAAIAGPVFGGIIVGLLGWRYVFFLSVPLAAMALLAAVVILEGTTAASPASPGEPARPNGFDWLGAALSAGALVIFLLTMTTAYRLGWNSPAVVIALVGAAALAAAFIWWQRRAPEPMLALELFRQRLFSFGISASFLLFLGTTSVYFLMPFYLQKVLGYTPGQAGLIMAPSPLCFALLGPLSGRLSDRFGWRRFTLLGLIFSGTSLLLLTQLAPNSPVGLVLAAMAIQGMGMGMFFSPNASAVLSTVERSRYGIATAFMNMTRNAANVTGVALATTVVTALMSSQGYEPSLDAVSLAGGEGVKSAFTQGLRTIYLAMSGLVLVAIILSASAKDAPTAHAAVRKVDSKATDPQATSKV